MLKIYFASKTTNAEKIKKLRQEWKEFHFTSRWIFSIGQVQDSPEEAKKFWIDDLHDVERADVVVCFGEGDDILRGALVEVGMAIGQGKKVIVVGNRRCYGTWQHHPNVLRVTDLAEARQVLNLMGAGK